MIDVKEAAKTAAEYFAELYPDQKYTNILLEEVEYDADEKIWLITIGYNELFFAGKRRYKIFRIDEENGNVLSMKIRPVENA